MGLRAFLLTAGIGVTVGATVALLMLGQQRNYETNNFISNTPFRVIEHPTCGVCLEEENCDISILNCGHWMHARCLQELNKKSAHKNKNKCPFCRAPIL